MNVVQPTWTALRAHRIIDPVSVTNLQSPIDMGNAGLSPIFPEVAIVTKQEVLQIPIFGWYLRHSPMIFIDRNSGPNALRKMIEESKRMSTVRRSILIFPEGSRMSANEPVRFRRGVEILYAQLGLPVLPVAVNSGLYWDRCYKRPGTITVSHLEPTASDLPPRTFARTIEEAIAGEVRQLVK